MKKKRVENCWWVVYSHAPRTWESDHHNLRATFLNKDSTIVLTDSIVHTMDTFGDHREGIFLVLGDHITVDILCIQDILTSAICRLQVHTNLTIYTELTDRVGRENEESVERHRTQVVCGGFLSPPLKPLWGIRGDSAMGGCDDFSIVHPPEFFILSQRSCIISTTSSWLIVSSSHRTLSRVVYISPLDMQRINFS